MVSRFYHFCRSPPCPGGELIATCPEGERRTTFGPGPIIKGRGQRSGVWDRVSNLLGSFLMVFLNNRSLTAESDNLEEN